MYYFYILRSDADKHYYYGSSKDLVVRFKQHNDGLVQSTKGRRPFTLVYYEAYLTYAQALEREKTIKRSGTARDAVHKRIGA